MSRALSIDSVLSRNTDNDLYDSDTFILGKNGWVNDGWELTFEDIERQMANGPLNRDDLWIWLFYVPTYHDSLDFANVEDEFGSFMSKVVVCEEKSRRLGDHIYKVEWAPCRVQVESLGQTDRLNVLTYVANYLMDRGDSRVNAIPILD